ncbi:MAG: 4Fe-4S dicluster domain-containing protein [Candidatus Cloacimonetes bacterium]|nr:4Fe-4S dicluster domain-containing protein [Candidatus Cloacimonadota bacterium]
MPQFKIEKDKFKQFFSTLLDEYTVFAPVEVEGISSFSKVKSAEELISIYHNSDKPPKEIFFPQTQTMFNYDRDGIKIPEQKEKPIAIWGLRSCDLRSFLMLDKVFGIPGQLPGREDYEDPYWKEKFKDKLIFSLACNNPLSTCFCNWFGSGPFDKEGSDLFVVDIDNAFVIEGCSKKGVKFLSKLENSDLLIKAPDEDLKQTEVLKSNAEALLNPPVDLSPLNEKLKKIWNESIWEEISNKCLNCAACTYFCPTCHCFDIQDEGREDTGKRVRIWDSCMFPLFTQEASGHNPRPTSKDRLRQRIMHKFSYFVDNYSEMACVGCGRCIQICPVNLDIRETLKQIMDYKF